MHKLHRINDYSKIVPGNKYSTNKNGIVEILSRNGNKIIVKFIDTGYIKKTNINKLKSGVLKDNYKPRIHGIGFYGDDTSKNTEVKRILYTRWRNMLSRCYNINNKYYDIYGGSGGVTVDKRWYNFSNFLHDVEQLENWSEENLINKKISLDKDKLQQNKVSKVYSKDTCCWLSIKEQNQLIDFEKAHQHEMIPFAWSKGSQSGLFLGVSKFAKEHNLIKSQITKCINGECSQHKGYKFRKCTQKELDKLMQAFNDYPRDGR